MSGIIKKPTKRLLVNKLARTLTSTTDELNLDMFLSDVESLGFQNINKDDFLSSLSNLSENIKNAVNVLIHPYVYREGLLVGINGDSKTVEFFDFKRESKGTTFNQKGEMVIVDRDLPRLLYNPRTSVYEGFLLEKSSMNLIENSLCLDGESTNWERGELLAKGYHLAGGQEISIDVNINENRVYNFSFFVKLDSGNEPIFNDFFNSDFTLNVMENVESSTVENLGLGLYRVSFIIKNIGTKKLNVFKNSDTFNSETITVTGFQLEEGEDMTSYIPTNGYISYRLCDKISSQRDIVVFKNNSMIIDDEYFEINNLPFNYRFIDIDNYGKIVLESKGIDKFKYLSYFDSKE